MAGVMIVIIIAELERVIPIRAAIAFSKALTLN